MNATILRQLALTAPTPLARLAERAQNDSAPERQHHNSYYVFELWLRMAAPIAVARYRTGNKRATSLDESLQLLAQPAVGGLLAFLRSYARHFRDDPFASFFALPVDAPMAQGYAWASKHSGIEPKADPTLGDFAQTLVTYRNKHIGHGAMPARAFYRDGAVALFRVNWPVCGASHAGDPGTLHCDRRTERRGRLISHWRGLRVAGQSQDKAPRPGDRIGIRRHGEKCGLLRETPRTRLSIYFRGSFGRTTLSK